MLQHLHAGLARHTLSLVDRTALLDLVREQRRLLPGVAVDRVLVDGAVGGKVEDRLRVRIPRLLLVCFVAPVRRVDTVCSRNRLWLEVPLLHQIPLVGIIAIDRLLRPVPPHTSVLQHLVDGGELFHF